MKTSLFVLYSLSSWLLELYSPFKPTLLVVQNCKFLKHWWVNSSYKFYLLWYFLERHCGLGKIRRKIFDVCRPPRRLWSVYCRSEDWAFQSSLMLWHLVLFQHSDIFLKCWHFSTTKKKKALRNVFNHSLFISISLSSILNSTIKVIHIQVFERSNELIELLLLIEFIPC